MVLGWYQSGTRAVPGRCVGNTLLQVLRMLMLRGEWGHEPAGAEVAKHLPGSNVFCFTESKVRLYRSSTFYG